MIIGIMNLNFFGTKKVRKSQEFFDSEVRPPPLESIFWKNSWRNFFTAPKFLLTNVSQNGFWVSYTFLQKLSSFKFYSILEGNCVVHINNGAIKCKTFVDNCCKNCVWVSYTFLQKPSLFNHFWIRAWFSRNFFVCKINNFGKINIWRFWWRRNVMKTKIDCQKLKRKLM